MSSQKLRIGLDFDDVLVATARCTIDIYNKQYGTSLSYSNWYNVNPALGWGVDTAQAASKRILSIHKSEFFADIIEPIDGSQNSLRRLKDAGCSLFIITGRPESIRSHTIQTINKYFPSLFDESSVYFTDHFEQDGKKLSKSDIVNELNLDYFVDDQVDHVNEIVKTKAKTILFGGDYDWNRQGYDDKVIKCCDWGEVSACIGDSGDMGHGK